MTEKILHKQVCQYLRMQFPDVLFNSDLSGAMRLTIGQAVAIKSLRSNRGFPDLVIYRPKIWIENFESHIYYGLFIELKKDGEKLHKRDGSFVSEHIEEQQKCIDRLNNLGYYACFGIGFDACKSVLDWYLK